MSTPEFRRVADDIAAQIADQELRPGQQLPSYGDLAKQYDVGLSTVRAAMLLLRERGLVVGMPGKGTFVAETDR